MIISTLNLEQKYQDLLDKEFPRMPIRHVQLSDLGDEELTQVRILMTYGYDMTPEVTKKMNHLEWLHVGQSGMDPLAFDLLQEKGIHITNSRGINSSIISEYVLCAMLNVVRKSFVFAERARQKIWAADIEVEELVAMVMQVHAFGRSI